MTSHNLESRKKGKRKMRPQSPRQQQSELKIEPAERDSEQMAEELRRLIAEFPPSADSTPRQQDEQEGGHSPVYTQRVMMVHMCQEDRHDLVVVPVSPDRLSVSYYHLARTRSRSCCT